MLKQHWLHVARFRSGENTRFLSISVLLFPCVFSKVIWVCIFIASELFGLCCVFLPHHEKQQFVQGGSCGLFLHSDSQCQWMLKKKPVFLEYEHLFLTIAVFVTIICVNRHTQNYSPTDLICSLLKLLGKCTWASCVLEWDLPSTQLSLESGASRWVWGASHFEGKGRCKWFWQHCPAPTTLLTPVSSILETMWFSGKTLVMGNRGLWKWVPLSCGWEVTMGLLCVCAKKKISVYTEIVQGGMFCC